MKNCIIAIALALIGAAGSAHAQDTKPENSDAPSWVHRPGPDIYDQYYPPAAQQQNVAGRVVLTCHVLANATHTCTIDEETAQGWGFGEAAMAISHSFRFAPARRNGRDISGGRVRVPIAFRFPRERAPSPYDEFVDPEQPAFSYPPVWEEAPTFLEVMRVYPNQALHEQVRGRALLSCLVGADRRLNCQTEMEMPSDRGFGAAALQLSREFRVSEMDTETLSRHRRERMLLPIYFGPQREMTPVPPLTGIAPVVMTLPVPIEAPFYPAPARLAGVSGQANILCTFGADTRCVLEREEPEIWRFGEAALEIANSFPHETLPEYFGTIDGDQMRFQFQFLAN